MEAPAAAAAASPAATSAAPKKAASLPGTATRSVKWSSAHAGVIVGEQFARGKNMVYEVVSTPEQPFAPGSKTFYAAHKIVNKKQYAVWDLSLANAHCINVRDLDKDIEDRSAYDTVVQTDRFTLHFVSQEGAMRMLRNFLGAKVGLAAPVEGIKVVKAMGELKKSALDRDNCLGEGPAGGTWMPWSAYNHIVKEAHAKVHGPADNGAAKPAAAAAAAASTPSGSKRKAPGGAAAAAAASVAGGPVPPLLRQLAQEHVDNELMPRVLAMSKTNDNPLQALDAVIRQFHAVWSLPDHEHLQGDMACKYNVRYDNHKKQKRDNGGAAAAAAAGPSASSSAAMVPVDWAIEMQVRMFLMVHPVGLAMIATMRSSLEQRAAEKAKNNAAFALAASQY